MVPLISLLVIIVLSISVIRVGAVALELTGLAPEVAAFQAQSAFSGAGDLEHRDKTKEEQ
jgi:hypothetical protein